MLTSVMTVWMFVLDLLRKSGSSKVSTAKLLAFAFGQSDFRKRSIEILLKRGIVPKLPNQPREINYEELGIKPRFNRVKFPQRENHCFYLCPFSEPFNSIYKDHVVKVITNEGFTIERADEIFGTQPIIEDIWEAINQAAITIADVTGKNPNVMYEIGMAHTIGKPVIIVTQDINDVPFDLKHYRCIIYEYTPRGCNNLEERLSATIKFLKNKL